MSIAVSLTLILFNTRVSCEKFFFFVFTILFSISTRIYGNIFVCSFQFQTFDRVILLNQMIVNSEENEMVLYYFRVTSLGTDFQFIDFTESMDSSQESYLIWLHSFVI